MSNLLKLLINNVMAPSLIDIHNTYTNLLTVVSVSSTRELQYNMIDDKLEIWMKSRSSVTRP